jgi:hypothetical protein
LSYESPRDATDIGEPFGVAHPEVLNPALAVMHLLTEAVVLVLASSDEVTRIQTLPVGEGLECEWAATGALPSFYSAGQVMARQPVVDAVLTRLAWSEASEDRESDTPRNLDSARGT